MKDNGTSTYTSMAKGSCFRAQAAFFSWDPDDLERFVSQSS